MYIDYPKETIDKIKELGLYGKSLKEIMMISVRACTDMMNNTKTNDYDTPTQFRKDIQTLQENQIRLMYKYEDLKVNNR